MYEAIRTAILSRSFTPGQRLNVHELASELNVSPTPVKDALTRLEAESLVQIRPRSGTFVAAISPDDVAEVFEIRCALECLAVEKAQARATAEDIQQLLALSGEIATPRDDDDARVVHATRNAEFHRKIVLLSGSRRLLQMYDSLDAHIQIARIHLRHADWKTRLASERDEHVAVVKALQRRDGAAAASALRRHILRAAESLVHDLRTLDSDDAAPPAVETAF